MSSDSARLYYKDEYSRDSKKLPSDESACLRNSGRDKSTTIPLSSSDNMKGKDSSCLENRFLNSKTIHSRQYHNSMENLHARMQDSPEALSNNYPSFKTVAFHKNNPTPSFPSPLVSPRFLQIGPSTQPTPQFMLGLQGEKPQGLDSNSHNSSFLDRQVNEIHNNTQLSNATPANCSKDSSFLSTFNLQSHSNHNHNSTSQQPNLLLFTSAGSQSQAVDGSLCLSRVNSRSTSFSVSHPLSASYSRTHSRSVSRSHSRIPSRRFSTLRDTTVMNHDSIEEDSYLRLSAKRHNSGPTGRSSAASTASSPSRNMYSMSGRNFIPFIGSGQGSTHGSIHNFIHESVHEVVDETARDSGPEGSDSVPETPLKSSRVSKPQHTLQFMIGHDHSPTHPLLGTPNSSRNSFKRRFDEASLPPSELPMTSSHNTLPLDSTPDFIQDRHGAYIDHARRFMTELSNPPSDNVSSQLPLSSSDGTGLRREYSNPRAMYNITSTKESIHPIRNASHRTEIITNDHLNDNVIAQSRGRLLSRTGSDNRSRSRSPVSSIIRSTGTRVGGTGSEASVSSPIYNDISSKPSSDHLITQYSFLRTNASPAMISPPAQSNLASRSLTRASTNLNHNSQAAHMIQAVPQRSNSIFVESDLSKFIAPSSTSFRPSSSPNVTAYNIVDSASVVTNIATSTHLDLNLNHSGPDSLLLRRDHTRSHCVLPNYAPDKRRSDPDDTNASPAFRLGMSPPLALPTLNLAPSDVSSTSSTRSLEHEEDVVTASFPNPLATYSALTHFGKKTNEKSNEKQNSDAYTAFSTPSTSSALVSPTSKKSPRPPATPKMIKTQPSKTPSNGSIPATSTGVPGGPLLSPSGTKKVPRPPSTPRTGTIPTGFGSNNTTTTFTNNTDNNNTNPSASLLAIPASSSTGPSVLFHSHIAHPFPAVSNQKPQASTSLFPSLNTINDGPYGSTTTAPVSNTFGLPSLSSRKMSVTHSRGGGHLKRGSLSSHSRAGAQSVNIFKGEKRRQSHSHSHSHSNNHSHNHASAIGNNSMNMIGGVGNYGVFLPSPQDGGAVNHSGSGGLGGVPNGLTGSTNNSNTLNSLKGSQAGLNGLNSFSTGTYLGANYLTIPVDSGDPTSQPSLNSYPSPDTNMSTGIGIEAATSSFNIGHNLSDTTSSQHISNSFKRTMGGGMSYPPQEDSRVSTSGYGGYGDTSMSISGTGQGYSVTGHYGIPHARHGITSRLQSHNGHPGAGHALSEGNASLSPSHSLVSTHSQNNSGSGRSRDSDDFCFVPDETNETIQAIRNAEAVDVRILRRKKEQELEMEKEISISRPSMGMGKGGIVSRSRPLEFSQLPMDLARLDVRVNTVPETRNVVLILDQQAMVPSYHGSAEDSNHSSEEDLRKQNQHPHTILNIGIGMGSVGNGDVSAGLTPLKAPLVESGYSHSIDSDPESRPASEGLATTPPPSNIDDWKSTVKHIFDRAAPPGGAPTSRRSKRNDIKRDFDTNGLNGSSIPPFLQNQTRAQSQNYAVSLSLPQAHYRLQPQSHSLLSHQGLAYPHGQPVLHRSPRDFSSHTNTNTNTNTHTHTQTHTFTTHTNMALTRTQLNASQSQLHSSQTHWHGPHLSSSSHGDIYYPGSNTAYARGNGASGSSGPGGEVVYTPFGHTGVPYEITSSNVNEFGEETGTTPYEAQYSSSYVQSQLQGQGQLQGQMLNSSRIHPQTSNVPGSHTHAHGLPQTQAQICAQGQAGHAVVGDTREELPAGFEPPASRDHSFSQGASLSQFQGGALVPGDANSRTHTHTNTHVQSQTQERAFTHSQSQSQYHDHGIGLTPSQGVSTSRLNSQSRNHTHSVSRNPSIGGFLDINNGLGTQSHQGIIGMNGHGQHTQSTQNWEPQSLQLNSQIFLNSQLKPPLIVSDSSFAQYAQPQAQLQMQMPLFPSRKESLFSSHSKEHNLLGSSFYPRKSEIEDDSNIPQNEDITSPLSLSALTYATTTNSTSGTTGQPLQFPPLGARFNTLPNRQSQDFTSTVHPSTRRASISDHHLRTSGTGMGTGFVASQRSLRPPSSSPFGIHGGNVSGNTFRPSQPPQFSTLSHVSEVTHLSSFSSTIDNGLQITPIKAVQVQKEVSILEGNSPRLQAERSSFSRNNSVSSVSRPSLNLIGSGLSTGIGGIGTGTSLGIGIGSIGSIGAGGSIHIHAHPGTSVGSGFTPGNSRRGSISSKRNSILGGTGVSAFNSINRASTSTPSLINGSTIVQTIPMSTIGITSRKGSIGNGFGMVGGNTNISGTIGSGSNSLNPNNSTSISTSTSIPSVLALNLPGFGALSAPTHTGSSFFSDAENELTNSGTIGIERRPWERTRDGRTSALGNRISPSPSSLGIPSFNPGSGVGISNTSNHVVSSHNGGIGLNSTMIHTHVHTHSHVHLNPNKSLDKIQEMAERAETDGTDVDIELDQSQGQNCLQKELGLTLNSSFAGGTSNSLESSDRIPTWVKNGRLGGFPSAISVPSNSKELYRSQFAPSPSNEGKSSHGLQYRPFSDLDEDAFASASASASAATPASTPGTSASVGDFSTSFRPNSQNESGSGRGSYIAFSIADGSSNSNSKSVLSFSPDCKKLLNESRAGTYSASNLQPYGPSHPLSQHPSHPRSNSGFPTTGYFGENSGTPGSLTFRQQLSRASLYDQSQSQGRPTQSALSQSQSRSQSIQYSDYHHGDGSSGVSPNKSAMGIGIGMGDSSDMSLAIPHGDSTAVASLSRIEGSASMHSLGCSMSELQVNTDQFGEYDRTPIFALNRPQTQVRSSGQHIPQAVDERNSPLNSAVINSSDFIRSPVSLIPNTLFSSENIVDSSPAELSSPTLPGISRVPYNSGLSGVAFMRDSPRLLETENIDSEVKQKDEKEVAKKEEILEKEIVIDNEDKTTNIDNTLKNTYPFPGITEQFAHSHSLSHSISRSSQSQSNPSLSHSHSRSLSHAQKHPKASHLLLHVTVSDASAPDNEASPHPIAHSAFRSQSSFQNRSHLSQSQSQLSHSEQSLGSGVSRHSISQCQVAPIFSPGVQSRRSLQSLSSINPIISHSASASASASTSSGLSNGFVPSVFAVRPNSSDVMNMTTRVGLGVGTGSSKTSGIGHGTTTTVESGVALGSYAKRTPMPSPLAGGFQRTQIPTDFPTIPNFPGSQTVPQNISSQIDFTQTPPQRHLQSFPYQQQSAHVPLPLLSPGQAQSQALVHESLQTSSSARFPHLSHLQSQGSYHEPVSSLSPAAVAQSQANPRASTSNFTSSSKTQSQQPSLHQISSGSNTTADAIAGIPVASPRSSTDVPSSYSKSIIPSSSHHAPAVDLRSTYLKDRSINKIGKKIRSTTSGLGTLLDPKEAKEIKTVRDRDLGGRSSSDDLWVDKNDHRNDEEKSQRGLPKSSKLRPSKESKTLKDRTKKDSKHGVSSGSNISSGSGSEELRILQTSARSNSKGHTKSAKSFSSMDTASSEKNLHIMRVPSHSHQSFHAHSLTSAASGVGISSANAPSSSYLNSIDQDTHSSSVDGSSTAVGLDGLSLNVNVTSPSSLQRELTSLSHDLGDGEGDGPFSPHLPSATSFDEEGGLYSKNDRKVKPKNTFFKKLSSLFKKRTGSPAPGSPTYSSTRERGQTSDGIALQPNSPYSHSPHGISIADTGFSNTVRNDRSASIPARNPRLPLVDEENTYVNSFDHSRDSDEN